MDAPQNPFDFDQCGTRTTSCGYPYRRHACPEVLRCTATPRGRNAVHSAKPLPASHFWMTSATCILFLSCIIMCPLPLMPMSGRLTQSTVPPAALIAFAYSVSIFLNVDQRGC